MNGETNGETSGGSAVRFEGVGKRFGDTWVLRDIDLDVPRGTIIGLIGPSGSGKTTTVRLMTGAYVPDAGTVSVLGVDPISRPRRERAVMGYLPQRPVLFDELSLWENMNYHASLNGVPLRRRSRLNELLELAELDGHERKLVRESSGGMQRRLALASTLVHAPPLVLLDEPTAGIDPILRRRFWEYFRSLRDAGDTLVISTQFVDEAAHCDVVGLLADGRLVATGRPDELRRLAYGGDLVDLEFERRVREVDLRRCDEIDGVVTTTYRGDTAIRLVVEPGSQARAVLAETVVGGDPDISGPVDVAADWDDVFIRLVDMRVEVPA